jgi:hypothetical protein
VLVVLVDAVAPIELEPGHQAAAGPEMAGATGHQRGLRALAGEQRHVAGHDHDVEAAAEVECRVGQVAVHPGQLGPEPAGRADHRRVGVDADDLEPSTRQLDGHPARPAPGVEHADRLQRGDEGRLAVHVGARRGQLVEPLLVLIAVPVHRRSLAPTGPGTPAREAPRSLGAAVRCRCSLQG